MAACRRDHLLAKRKCVTWAELGQYDYMTVAKASGNRFLLDLALAETANSPRPFCEVRHILMAVSLVEAGLGIAAVPRLAMPLDDHPTLISILPTRASRYPYCRLNPSLGPYSFASCPAAL